MLDGEQWRQIGRGVAANSWRGREESLNCWPDVHDPEKWTRVRETNGVKEKKERRQAKGKRQAPRLTAGRGGREAAGRQKVLRIVAYNGEAANHKNVAWKHRRKSLFLEWDSPWVCTLSFRNFKCYNRFRLFHLQVPPSS